MTLDNLNHLLSERGIRAAIKYAKSTGEIHYEETLKSTTKPVRRVSLHINDDGSAYIVLHRDHFDGTEQPQ